MTDFAEICIEFVHTTVEVPQKFKVKGVKVKVTALSNLSASTNRYISLNFAEVSRTLNTMFKVIRSNIEIAIT